MTGRNRMTTRNAKPNASMAAQAAIVALGGNQTGASVATVGGEPLYEGQVDAYLSAMRRLLGLETPGAWRRWLADLGMADAGVRYETADYLVNFILMEQMVHACGIEVSDADVFCQINTAEQEAGGDMMLVMELAERGLTRSQYTEGIRACLLRAALVDDVAHDISLPADGEVLDFLKDASVVRRKAKLHDVSENELQAGREALDAKRKAAVFDERLKEYRESIDVKWADGWGAGTA